MKEDKIPSLQPPNTYIVYLIYRKIQQVVQARCSTNQEYSHTCHQPWKKQKRTWTRRILNFVAVREDKNRDDVISLTPILLAHQELNILPTQLKCSLAGSILLSTSLPI